jgi:hypothetical protein
MTRTTQFAAGELHELHLKTWVFGFIIKVYP